MRLPASLPGLCRALPLDEREVALLGRVDQVQSLHCSNDGQERGRLWNAYGVDQDQAPDRSRVERRGLHRDERAHGMADEIEGSEAKLPGRFQHILGVAAPAVRTWGGGWTQAAAAEIEGKELAGCAGERLRDRVEAVCVRRESGDADHRCATVGTSAQGVQAARGEL